MNPNNPNPKNSPSNEKEKIERRIVITKKGKIIYDKPVGTFGCEHTIIGNIDVRDVMVGTNYNWEIKCIKDRLK